MDLFSKQTSVFSVKDMCLPAKVYFVLSMLAVVFSGIMSFKVSTIVFSVVVLIFWTFLLNWICILGFKGISWTLVILPFIIILFTVVIAGETINQNNRNDPNNLSGAAISQLYGTISNMEDQLNNFLGTPGPHNSPTRYNAPTTNAFVPPTNAFVPSTNAFVTPPSGSCDTSLPIGGGPAYANKPGYNQYGWPQIYFDANGMWNALGQKCLNSLPNGQFSYK
jgi:hypothetical protein